MSCYTGTPLEPRPDNSQTYTTRVPPRFNSVHRPPYRGWCNCINNTGGPMVTMNLQHHDIPQNVLIHLRLEFLLLLNLAFFFLNRICICIYRRLGGGVAKEGWGGGGLKNVFMQWWGLHNVVDENSSFIKSIFLM